MSNTRASAQVRERFTAILLELQANRIILHELANRYKMFRFTGGAVPRERWRLVALTSYLEYPFAADRLSSDEAQRYRYLAEAIMALGQTVGAGRPRTLRARWGVAKTFAAASVEIHALGVTLEAGLTTLLQELDDSSDFSQWMQAFANGEQDSSPAEAVGITAGGDHE